MNREEREHLRAIASDVLVRDFNPPWHEAGGWWCYVERRKTPLSYRIGRAVLFGFDGRAAVFRRYTFEVRAAPREENVSVQAADVARLLARLVRLGLWELNDVLPYVPILGGGSAHVVKAVGPKEPLAILPPPVADACLAIPEYATSRDIRRIGRAFDHLLSWTGPPRTTLGRLSARLGLY